MKTKRFELYTNGVCEVTERPYTADDYLADIAALENEITPRRQREALTSESGKAWIIAKELEINALREEMRGL